MSDVLVEEKDGIVRVTLNRAAVHNALSRDVNLELQQIALGFEDRDDVRAVVLTGAGDKSFCAGADLKERKGVPASEAAPFINAISSAIESWAAIRAPTICLMNGSAYGGGLELAMACDFRILVASTQAAPVALGLTEVRLGIMPGAGGTQRLPRLVGEARAKEMILTGKKISAERALEIGLVTQIVSRDKLVAAGEELLAELSKCAPMSIQAAKSAIEKGYGRSMDEALAIEREQYDRTLYSEDRDEGLAAFAEGRPPRYQGR